VGLGTEPRSLADAATYCSSKPVIIWIQTPHVLFVCTRRGEKRETRAKRFIRNLFAICNVEQIAYSTHLVMAMLVKMNKEKGFDESHDHDCLFLVRFGEIKTGSTAGKRNGMEADKIEGLQPHTETNHHPREFHISNGSYSYPTYLPCVHLKSNNKSDRCHRRSFIVLDFSLPQGAFHNGFSQKLFSAFQRLSCGPCRETYCNGDS
jgi:hypothetical protein